MKLPKYIKKWETERVNSGYSEHPKQVYLIFEEYNPTLHHGEWKTTRLLQWDSGLYPCNQMYFFEIFKYLRKFQLWRETDGLRKSLEEVNIVKKKIKQHLMIKHYKQLNVKVKLSYLPNYVKFINYCFDTLDNRAKITLVIQKKIGYKYYENTIYY
jgi:hypothetical protein